MRRNNGSGMYRWLRESFLSGMTLNQMEDLRKQFADLLKDIGFLPQSFRYGPGRKGRYNSSSRSNNDSADSITQIEANANSSNLQLVKAILCAGLYPNIIVAPRELVAGKGVKKAGDCAFFSRKGDVHLHPSTISFTEKILDSRYCCYHSIVKTSKIYVRDCTTVSEVSSHWFDCILVPTRYQVFRHFLIPSFWIFCILP